MPVARKAKAIPGDDGVVAVPTNPYHLFTWWPHVFEQRRKLRCQRPPNQGAPGTGVQAL